MSEPNIFAEVFDPGTFVDSPRFCSKFKQKVCWLVVSTYLKLVKLDHLFQGGVKIWNAWNHLMKRFGVSGFNSPKFVSRKLRVLQMQDPETLPVEVFPDEIWGICSAVTLLIKYVSVTSILFELSSSWAAWQPLKEKQLVKLWSFLQYVQVKIQHLCNNQFFSALFFSGIQIRNSVFESPPPHQKWNGCQMSFDLTLRVARFNGLSARFRFKGCWYGASHISTIGLL